MYNVATHKNDFKIFNCKIFEQLNYECYLI